MCCSALQRVAVWCVFRVTKRECKICSLQQSPASTTQKSPATPQKSPLSLQTSPASPQKNPASPEKSDSPYDAVWCSAMHCVAVCCSVLQCVAVSCSMLQCVAVWIALSHVFLRHVLESRLTLWNISVSHGTYEWGMAQTCITETMLGSERVMLRTHMQRYLTSTKNTHGVCALDKDTYSHSQQIHIRRHRVLGWLPKYYDYSRHYLSDRISAVCIFQWELCFWNSLRTRGYCNTVSSMNV